MLKKLMFYIVVLGFSLAVFIAIAPAASAFSGGAGSSGNPFIITTCAEFQQIEDGGGYYRLGNDIDCTGVSYQPMPQSSGTATGTIDGAGYAISNVNVAVDGVPMGLFKAFNGTIKNLEIKDSSFVTNSDNAGAFFGIGSGSLTNVKATNVAVTGNNSSIYVGGLAGIMSSGTISESSFNGSVTGPNSDGAGGLVGYANNLTITNSYSKGSVAGGSFIGGVVGVGTSTILTKVYILATISAGMGSGGVIGVSNGYMEVHDSFVAGAIQTGASYGAIYGDTADYMDNTYYDQARSGVFKCSGLGNPPCIPVNIGGSDPNYFFNTSTHAPLDTWDFENVWTLVPGDYPILNTSPKVPMHITTTADLTSLTVHWDSPADDGGRNISGYHLTYTARGGSLVDVPGIAASARSYTISGLDLSTTYDIELSAVNVRGEGGAASFSADTASPLPLIVTTTPVTPMLEIVPTARSVNSGNAAVPTAATVPNKPIVVPAAEFLSKATVISKSPSRWHWWWLFVIFVILVLLWMQMRRKAQKES